MTADQKWMLTFCHISYYQNYQRSQQNLDIFLENKVPNTLKIIAIKEN